MRFRMYVGPQQVCSEFSAMSRCLKKYPDLPVKYKMKELMAIIQSSPVSIIVGRTGSGKSTLVPRMIADYHMEIKKYPWSCKILVSEPRRLSVLSLHGYMKNFSFDWEMGRLLGYHVRSGSECRATSLIEKFLAPVVDVSGITFSVERYFLDEIWEALNIQKAVKFDTNCLIDQCRGEESFELLKEMHKRMPRGTFLVFAAGAVDVNLLSEIFSENSDFAVGTLKKDSTKQDIRFALEESTSKRKIIVATNIAESSLTIPNVILVVNFGLTKKSICLAHGRRASSNQWASKAQNIQREGRCGRLMDGTAIHLMTSDFFAKLPDHNPEYAGHDLERTIVSAIFASRGNSTPRSILSECLNGTPSLMIHAATRRLQNAFACTTGSDRMELTVLGSLMHAMSLSLVEARLVFFGMCFGAWQNSLELAAILRTDVPYFSPPPPAEAPEVLIARLELAEDSDLLAHLVAKTKNPPYVRLNPIAVEAANKAYHEIFSAVLKIGNPRLPECSFPETYSRMMFYLLTAASAYPNYFYGKAENSHCDATPDQVKKSLVFKWQSLSPCRNALEDEIRKLFRNFKIESFTWTELSVRVQFLDTESITRITHPAVLFGMAHCLNTKCRPFANSSHNAEQNQARIQDVRGPYSPAACELKPYADVFESYYKFSKLSGVSTVGLFEEQRMCAFLRCVEYERISQLRYATVFPPIDGFPSICAALFAPKVEYVQDGGICSKIIAYHAAETLGSSWVKFMEIPTCLFDYDVSRINIVRKLLELCNSGERMQKFSPQQKKEVLHRIVSLSYDVLVFGDRVSVRAAKSGWKYLHAKELKRKYVELDQFSFDLLETSPATCRLCEESSPGIINSKSLLQKHLMSATHRKNLMALKVELERSEVNDQIIATFFLSTDIRSDEP
ncbi:unnamed protein product [Notodromas monacha]|uniref:Helicase C-terminal domain-containing protein n=1 Tax=Notodromas monacha TaxID=399045 RepID=A0A7R9G9D3_9CRUS|nr:unnamed protein product [Notodromas monacha]CAG0914092.1 unnamed protein product [Notodromas monacha]